jgi:hypothetical protein
MTLALFRERLDAGTRMIRVQALCRTDAQIPRLVSETVFQGQLASALSQGRETGVWSVGDGGESVMGWGGCRIDTDVCTDSLGTKPGEARDHLSTVSLNKVQRL